MNRPAKRFYFFLPLCYTGTNGGAQASRIRRRFSMDTIYLDNAATSFPNRRLWRGG